jgi:hypothetical protein
MQSVGFWVAGALAAAILGAAPVGAQSEGSSIDGYRENNLRSSSPYCFKDKVGYPEPWHPHKRAADPERARRCRPAIDPELSRRCRQAIDPELPQWSRRRVDPVPPRRYDDSVAPAPPRRYARAIHQAPTRGYNYVDNRTTSPLHKRVHTSVYAGYTGGYEKSADYYCACTRVTQRASIDRVSPIAGTRWRSTAYQARSSPYAYTGSTGYRQPYDYPIVRRKTSSTSYAVLPARARTSSRRSTRLISSPVPVPTGRGLYYTPRANMPTGPARGTQSTRPQGPSGYRPSRTINRLPDTPAGQ